MNENATIDTMIATLRSLKRTFGGDTKVRIDHPKAPGRQAVRQGHTMARHAGSVYVVLQASSK